MPFTIQPAVGSDSDVLLELMRAFYAEDGLPFDPDAARQALGPLLEGATWGKVWLARAGDEPAGYAVLTLCYSLEFGGLDAFVDELFVRPEQRGQGLGRQALAVVEATCRQLGVRALHLEVSRTNTRAQALYQGVGFHDRGYMLLTKRLDPINLPPTAP
jgi:GNAT superfamily N-acetyltransferase